MLRKLTGKSVINREKKEIMKIVETVKDRAGQMENGSEGSSWWNGKCGLETFHDKTIEVN